MQSGLMLFDAVNFSLLKEKIKDEIFVFCGWLEGKISALNRWAYRVKLASLEGYS